MDEKNGGSTPETQSTPENLAGALLLIRYVPVGTVAYWDNNPKLHDLGGLIKSFKLHGFRDAPIYDQTLNGGQGGIVAGNGRAAALTLMEENGDTPPKGVAVDGEGKWYMPVQFGLNAESLVQAEAFGVDHNNLTLTGGDLTLFDIAKIWDASTIDSLLQDLEDAGAEMASLDSEDIDVLLRPPFEFMPQTPTGDPATLEKDYIPLIIQVKNKQVVDDVIVAVRNLLLDNPGWDAKIQ